MEEVGKLAHDAACLSRRELISRRYAGRVLHVRITFFRHGLSGECHALP
jgi:hypothetical protein